MFHVIKKVATLIIDPLTDIFNMTFETGQIAMELKVALVTPVYKILSLHLISETKNSENVRT